MEPIPCRQLVPYWMLIAGKPRPCDSQTEGITPWGAGVVDSIVTGMMSSETVMRMKLVQVALALLDY